MIRITVDNNVPELTDKLQAAVGRFIRKGAFHIEGEIKSSMAEPKSGKAYRRKNDKVHIASAPGESPGVDSSNLLGSTQTITRNSLEAKVGTEVEYAQYLEFGTSRMAQRPVWEKTVQEVLPTLEKILEGEIRQIK